MVVGFAFDPEMENVLLIKKNRPQWQKGKLNGIGGKMELGENFHDAIAREFEEETGVKTNKEDWSLYVCMNKTTGQNTWSVYFFRIVFNIKSAKTTTDEEVVSIPVKDLPENVISNLHWLIPLAKESLLHPINMEVF